MKRKIIGNFLKENFPIDDTSSAFGCHYFDRFLFLIIKLMISVNFIFIFDIQNGLQCFCYMELKYDSFRLLHVISLCDNVMLFRSS